MEKCKRISLGILMVVSIVLLMSFLFSYQADAATKGKITGLTNMSDGIQVSWSKKTTSAGYKIYRKAGTATKWKLVKTVKSKSTLKWTDKNVKNGTKYRYKVRPYKGKKITSISTYKTIYRLDKAKITSTKPAGSSKYVINGKANNTTTGFKVYYSNKKNFSDYRVKSVKTKTPSITIDGLVNGKTYYVKMRAYRMVKDVKYYGAYSDVVEVKASEPIVSLLAVQSEGFKKEVVDEALAIYNSGDTEYSHATPGSVLADGCRAFDCSGYASYVLNKVMQKYCPVYWVTANLEKLYATGVIYNEGLKGEFKATTVCSGTWNPAKVQPGDLIFFNNPNTGSIYHVGIYVGDIDNDGENEFLHCTSDVNGVCMEEMNDTCYNFKRFSCAKSFVPDKIESLSKNMTVNIASGKYMRVYKTRDVSVATGIKQTKLYRGDEVILEYIDVEKMRGYITYSADGKVQHGFVYNPLGKLTER